MLESVLVLFLSNKSRNCMEALTDIASFYLSINNVVTKSNDIRVSLGTMHATLNTSTVMDVLNWRQFNTPVP